MDRITVARQQETRSFHIRFLAKMKGQGRSPLQINVKDALTGLIGGFLTIFALILLTKMTSALWLMAPFGASCVLAFGLWNAPLSQPRNIIGGHFVSTFVGLASYHFLGDEPWAIGLAVGLAIAVMMMTKTTHPPAGADPLVIMLGHYSWSYLFTPVLIGSVIIVFLALLINNLRSNRSYPTFWI
ncbi:MULTISPECIES: HPP family protein [Peribacillus]|uniref:HPP family protein n=1 Tax=Peribacillus TaxID=2675229 RepID=UPI003337A997